MSTQRIRIIAWIVECPAPKCPSRHSIRVSELGGIQTCLTCKKSHRPASTAKPNETGLVVNADETVMQVTLLEQ